MRRDKRGRFTKDIDASAVRWLKVEAPRAWKPKAVGHELVGYYGGRTLRNGPYSQYEVVVVHVPHSYTYMVSGTKIIQLVDAAAIQRGHEIRIVWQGTRLTGDLHTMKLFDLFVSDREPVDESELPSTFLAEGTS